MVYVTTASMFLYDQHRKNVSRSLPMSFVALRMPNVLVLPGLVAILLLKGHNFVGGRELCYVFRNCVSISYFISVLQNEHCII